MIGHFIAMSLAVGIAFGSNLGDRVGNLKAGLTALAADERVEQINAKSSLYETDPVDCPPSAGRFVNAVIELSWRGQALDLLDLALAIERSLGRVRGEPNAPRPLDLDLLYAGDMQIMTSQLVLPHPRLAQRLFVLQPLNEIRSDLVLPGTKVSVASLLAELDTSEPPLLRMRGGW